MGKNKKRHKEIIERLEKEGKVVAYVPSDNEWLDLKQRAEHEVPEDAEKQAAPVKKS